MAGKKGANGADWRTEDLFATREEWKAEAEAVDAAIDFAEYRGRLGDPEKFLAYLEKESAVAARLEKVYLYAHMNRDVDTRNAENLAMQQRAEGLISKFGAETAFVDPELVALEGGRLEAYIADPRFADYDYRLKCLADEKKHVLSAGEEKLLALGGETFGGFRDAFTAINNADLDFPEIAAHGKKVRVTHGAYSVLMQNPDRTVRRRAYEAYYDAFGKLLNTIAATYSGSVKKDVFLSRARKYESCLAHALSSEDVSPAVYTNLLKNVEAALPALHEYIRLKRAALGLRGKMYMYDMYVPVVGGADLKLSYEDAFALVKKGLAPLGTEYAALLDRAHDEGWIDVYEKPGKRSGAYSTGCWSAPHPYVLLNYQETTHDVFTIAHELGHAMHTFFSNRALPYSKADYRIFVAEVASTVNELLLLKYLLKTADDAELRKYLLSYELETVRTTLFRQTQFAEFEYVVHGMVERGEPLTKDEMNAEYRRLNEKYYGDAVASDDRIATEWARIPHFYTPFYVYKYATGIISAMAISDAILTEGAPAVERYFRFLSSGGSGKPTDLLKIAGVDLTGEGPFLRAMDSFRAVLAEFRREMKL